MTDDDWRNARIEEARKYVSEHDAYAGNHLLRDLANALEAAEKHQGEPSDPNEHTPACDAWADMNGSGCTCHVEQGEPSDAQVNAALNAHRLSDLLNSGYGPERFHKAPDLSYWHPDNVSNMRAALRAAGEVR